MLSVFIFSEKINVIPKTDQNTFSRYYRYYCNQSMRDRTLFFLSKK